MQDVRNVSTREATHTYEGASAHFSPVAGHARAGNM